jgi:arginyl-tRNA synthetase
MERQLRQIIEQVLKEKEYPQPEIQFRSIPFKGTWGLAANFLFPLLSLLKDSGQKIDREKISEEIINAVKAKASSLEGIEKIESEKGFVNFYFEPRGAARNILKRVLSENDNYGRGVDRDIKVMVEYSQPNTHKDLHIGHLRNICLGISLVNILRFAGYRTTAANYLGDIGTHVIKCLWGYMRFYAGIEPPSGRGRWLGEVYVFAESKYHASEQMRNEATEWLRTFFSKPANGAEAAVVQKTLVYMKDENILLTPNLDKKTLSENMVKTLTRIRKEITTLLHSGAVSLSHVHAIKDKLSLFDENGPIWNYIDEVIDMSRRWEEKDPELIELWKRTRDWSLAHFDSIYHELGSTFDVVFYESEVEEPGKLIVQELLDRGLAEVDEGAVVVKIDKKLGLDKETYRNFLILKSDGSSLYATKDLALARKKFEEFDIDRSIYLVDVGQSHYFQQLFKTLQLMGFERAKNCIHLAYGRVSLPEGKMSSRLGNVIHYSDLKNELIKRARHIVRLKQPQLDPEITKNIARMVAFGAMKYNMVKIDSDKDMIFDWDEALDYEGRTAPYIQYAHARACKILEKTGDFKADLICQKDLGEPEIELAKKLADFPAIIEKCANDAKPLHLATYVYELAQVFSDFYHRCPVSQESDEEIKSTRIALVQAVKIVTANGLQLLGIEAPVSM